MLDPDFCTARPGFAGMARDRHSAKLFDRSMKTLCRSCVRKYTATNRIHGSTPQLIAWHGDCVSGYARDSSSVAREAVKHAAEEGYDCVLIDTAGRMQVRRVCPPFHRLESCCGCMGQRGGWGLRRLACPASQRASLRRVALDGVCSILRVAFDQIRRSYGPVEVFVCAAGCCDRACWHRVPAVLLGVSITVLVSDTFAQ